MNRSYIIMAIALLAMVACSKFHDPKMAPEPVLEAEDPWLLKDLMDQVESGQGGPLKLDADFGGTRSQIEINAAGTYATTVWRGGDQFKMYGVSGNSYQTATFSTTEDGSSVSFNTSSSISFAGPYYTVYPGVKHLGINDDDVLLGVEVPSQQVAVPGNFANGLALSYTLAQSQTGALHFQSQVALFRFRMSGSLVSQIKTVTLKGTSPLAGDAVLVAGTDGSVALTQDRSFSGDSHFNTVTLSGDFEAGQDYYIVLYPGAQSALQIIFADSEGRSTTKTASEFTFPRSRISDFGTIDVGDQFTDGYVDPTPIAYKEASAGARKPVTIAVIPEGFTAEEMSTYEMLAKSGIDALMNTQPFKNYQEYFNVWILKVASQESGASITDGKGNVTTGVNTFFGAKWGEKVYSDMVANASEVYDYVSTHCPDIINGDHTIEEVPILMIINDERYGGICHTVSDGRGYCMVPYTNKGGTLPWSFPSIMPKTDEPLPNEAALHDYYMTTPQSFMDEIGGVNYGDWRNTLVHEFGGHCFSRLGDEYWSNTQLKRLSGSVQGQNWPVPFALNLASDPQDVLWQADLLNNKEDLVSANRLYERIGVFQGGDTATFGRWRSEKISCMIDNRFYFSAWQRMLIVKRIMTLSESEFDINSFWAKDDPTDPVRDQIASPVMGDVHPLPLQIMPMLPPPVLHEE